MEILEVSPPEATKVHFKRRQASSRPTPASTRNPFWLFFIHVLLTAIVLAVAFFKKNLLIKFIYLFAGHRRETWRITGQSTCPWRKRWWDLGPTIRTAFNAKTPTRRRNCLSLSDTSPCLTASLRRTSIKLFTMKNITF